MILPESKTGNKQPPNNQKCNECAESLANNTWEKNSDTTKYSRLKSLKRSSIKCTSCA